MDNTILKKLIGLERLIQTDCLPDSISSDCEWGTDVIIKNRPDGNTMNWLQTQPINDDLRRIGRRRRAVITEYSDQLNWLFYQLTEVFKPKIDYISEYDFYGLLAQSAIDYLGSDNEYKVSTELLLQVISGARRFTKKINAPDDPTLPFFAYGLFKPGQLGFFRIKDFIARITPDTVDGSLNEKDGIPLLFIDGSCTKISGYLLYFKPDYDIQGYKRIIGIEPDEVYKWDEVTVNSGARVNVLIARNNKGTNDLVNCVEWDGKNDPFFTDALVEVESILKSNLNYNQDSKNLLRLQMAYSLLWSAIERYTGLRYHLGKNVNAKVYSIAEEASFVDSLKRQVHIGDGYPRIVYSATGSDKCELDPDNPKKSIKYYYQVRSNAVHRGKAIDRDFYTVRSSLEELLHIFKDVLQEAFRESQL